jgi:hypothetical protein
MPEPNDSSSAFSAPDAHAQISGGCPHPRFDFTPDDIGLACVECGADSHDVERARRWAARPHYESGVLAPCDRCGEGDVLAVTERDYMGEPVEMACRACVEGWAEW